MPKFKPLYRIAARQSHREGLLSDHDYALVMETLRWPIRRHKRTGASVNVLKEVENLVYSSMTKQGARVDWQTIIQWIKDNWTTILKLIMSLLVFLAPPQQEK